MRNPDAAKGIKGHTFGLPDEVISIEQLIGRSFTTKLYIITEHGNYEWTGNRSERGNYPNTEYEVHAVEFVVEHSNAQSYPESLWFELPEDLTNAKLTANALDAAYEFGRSESAKSLAKNVLSAAGVNGDRYIK